MMTLQITLQQVCWNLGFRFCTAISMLGCHVPPTQLTAVSQLQAHSSELCLATLGLGQHKFQVSFVSHLPIGVLQKALAGQGKGEETASRFACPSFQGQASSNLVAAAGSSLSLLSTIPEQCPLRWSGTSHLHPAPQCTLELLKHQHSPGASTCEGSEPLWFLLEPPSQLLGGDSVSSLFSQSQETYGQCLCVRGLLHTTSLGNSLQ